jgi:hypothetical protein
MKYLPSKHEAQSPNIITDQKKAKKRLYKSENIFIVYILQNCTAT